MRNVVAYLDHADNLEQVCDYASWVAIKLNAPLDLLHVSPDPAASPHFDAAAPPSHEGQVATLERVDHDKVALASQAQVRQLLEHATHRVMAHGVNEMATSWQHGEGMEVLLELEASTRFYVLGPGDPDPSSLPIVLSPTVDLAIRTLSRPILVARTPFKTPENFLLAFDGSEAGRKFVQRLADSPLMRDLECHIVTVGRGQEALDWAAERFDEAGFHISTYQLVGDPSQAVPAFAKQHAMDILILGAYGHSGMRPAMLGSTTAAILQCSRMSVLVLR